MQDPLPDRSGSLHSSTTTIRVAARRSACIAGRLAKADVHMAVAADRGCQAKGSSSSGRERVDRDAAEGVRPSLAAGAHLTARRPTRRTQSVDDRAQPVPEPLPRRGGSLS